MEKLRIGISIGDINGVGLEVILKTLSNAQIANICTPIVYGSSKIVSYHKNIVGVDFHFNSSQGIHRISPDRINIINCWQENVNITIGKPSEESGQYALRSLEAAANDLVAGDLDGLVTGPVSKHAMQLANFPFPGHTEYLSSKLEGDNLMFMVNDKLRIGVVTNHLPLREVADSITKELIIKKIQIMNNSLKMDFGLERPTIAVLGLNPHAGDNGFLGGEEETVIRPAVVECKKNGLMAMGPFSADGFFGSGQYAKFDGILAMYHDQGLIPFKALSFGSGVNFTAGLSAVRTSPDHGTGFDIAGKNMADPSSFRRAIFLAMDIIRHRKNFHKMHENALVKKEKPVVAEGEDEIIED